MHKDCDLTQFRSALESHQPYSAIIMSGGGNFNDYYWDDHPARIEMIKQFPQFPIRAFPQSVYMTKPHRINQTKEAFRQHPDLQLAARDQASFDWLMESFDEAPGVSSLMTPDIAFMWGDRSDFRTDTEKT